MCKPKPKQTKMTQTNQTKTKSIKKKIQLIDNDIIRVMNKYINENERNPYIKASEEIDEGFTSKQIRQRWISYLNPDLCHEELCEDEKLYIIEWVEEYKNNHPSNVISWKQLILELKNNKKFGKLRTENKVKNHWYLKKRQEKRRGQLPSKDDASSSPQASSSQYSNSPKSVPSSPQDSNVSTIVSSSSKDNNVSKSVPYSLQDNNASTIVSSYPQDDNVSKSVPFYPQVNNVLKSVPTSPRDNNVSTIVSPSPQDNNDLKSVSSSMFHNNNVQERQVSDKMKIDSLLN